MAKDKNPGEYAGESKAGAAAKGFLSEFAIWGAISIGIGLIIDKITKQPIAESMSKWVSEGGWKWDAAIATGFGVFAAFNGYKKAEAAELQHEQLKNENTMLRTQMAQTGAALTQVGLNIQQQGAGHAAGVQPRGSHAEAVLSETPQELAR